MPCTGQLRVITLPLITFGRSSRLVESMVGGTEIESFKQEIMKLGYRTIKINYYAKFEGKKIKYVIKK